jgi:hypothetical protein
MITDNVTLVISLFALVFSAYALGVSYRDWRRRTPGRKAYKAKMRQERREQRRQNYEVLRELGYGHTQAYVKAWWQVSHGVLAAFATAHFKCARPSA